MSPWVWALLAMNALALFLMGLDKLRSARRRRRVSERTLFLSALLGGALGATLGMLLFHHKTRKPAFAWGLPLLSIAQLLGILCLITP